MAVLTEVMIHHRFPTRNDDLIIIDKYKEQVWRLLMQCWNRDSALRPEAAQVFSAVSRFLETHDEHRNRFCTISVVRHCKRINDFCRGYNRRCIKLESTHSRAWSEYDLCIQDARIISVGQELRSRTEGRSPEDQSVSAGNIKSEPRSL